MKRSALDRLAACCRAARPAQLDGPRAAAAPGPTPTRRGLLLAGAGLGLAGLAGAQDEYGEAALRGAGSTFVQPLMDAWVRRYRDDPHGLLAGSRGPGAGLDGRLASDGLDYEPVGSLAGIQRIRAGFVDVAAGEMPLGEDALRRGGLLQFPWVTGGVAIVVSGLGERAPVLDGATLAGIYLGRITSWSDPALKALNPGLTLPDAPIVPWHRADGSGTTYTLARWLAGHDEDWRRRLGADLVLRWPLGRAAKGSSGMVDALRATPLSIGYVNAVQARAGGLPIAALRNRAGQAVLPEPAAIGAALAAGAGPATATDGPERLPIDASGASSYPVVATVFGLMAAPIRSARARRTAAFVTWTLREGRSVADRLGYQSLPEPLARAAIERLQPGA